jgi:hypothetical protein
MTEKTPVDIEWCERYPHLWLTTLEEEMEFCKEEGISLQDSWKLDKLVPIPTELVIKYQAAMTALWEVEAAVKQIEKENNDNKTT